MRLAFVLIAMIFAVILLSKLKFSFSYSDGQIVTEIRLSIFKLPTDKKKGKKKSSIDAKFRILKSLFGIRNELKEYIRIEKLKISYLSADRDPYNAVMKYNIVNAVTGSALLFAENSRKIRNKSICINTDFTQEEQKTKMVLGLSIRVWQIALLCFRMDESILKLLTHRQ